MSQIIQSDDAIAEELLLQQQEEDAALGAYYAKIADFCDEDEQQALHKAVFG